MSNLLKETWDLILQTKHALEDIAFIGSLSGFGCTWEEFRALADKEYDCGYGGREVAEDLIILFKDGSWLEREEYDGSEWWALRSTPVPPLVCRPIRNLFKNGIVQNGDTELKNMQGLIEEHGWQLLYENEKPVYIGDHITPLGNVAGGHYPREIGKTGTFYVDHEPGYFVPELHGMKWVKK